VADLAGTIANQPDPNGLRIGVVASTVPLVINVQGGLIENAGALRSVRVNVGDTVALFRQDDTWLCLGRIVVADATTGDAEEQVALSTTNLAASSGSTAAGAESSAASTWNAGSTTVWRIEPQSTYRIDWHLQGFQNFAFGQAMSALIRRDTAAGQGLLGLYTMIPGQTGNLNLDFFAWGYVVNRSSAVITMGLFPTVARGFSAGGAGNIGMAVGGVVMKRVGNLTHPANLCGDAVVLT
jgi:hypothetical protein